MSTNTTTLPNSQESPTKRVLRWLWNPFTYTAGAPALISGLVIIVATSAIGALSNTHFDGVLDTHTGRPAPLWFFLSQGIVNWLSMAIVLLIAGLILNPRDRRFRAIDLFGTQALARWPFVLVAIACLLPGYGRYIGALNESLLSMQGGQFVWPKASILDMLTFSGIVGLMLLCLVWFVALAWKAFRISCDVKGWQAIVAFVAGILMAEVISKVVITMGVRLI